MDEYPKEAPLALWAAHLSQALTILNEVPTMTPDAGETYPHGEALAEIRLKLRTIAVQVDQAALDRGLPF